MNYQVDKRTKGLLVGRGPRAIGRLLLGMHRLEVSARYRLLLFRQSPFSSERTPFRVLMNCKYTGQIDFQAISTCVKHLYKVYLYKLK